MAEYREVVDLTLSSGATIPAAEARCPECRTVDVNTDFQRLAAGRYRATCPQGHRWDITLTSGRPEV